jgi:hypothetical protein
VNPEPPCFVSHPVEETRDGTVGAVGRKEREREREREFKKGRGKM